MEFTTQQTYIIDLVNQNNLQFIFCCSYVTTSNEIVLTLQINNIEETDDAEYVCEVIVGINKKIKEKVDLRSEIQ